MSKVLQQYQYLIPFLWLPLQLIIESVDSSILDFPGKAELIINMDFNFFCCRAYSNLDDAKSIEVSKR